MFEIRIICDPVDTDHVVAALDSAFNPGTVTVYPARNGRSRLYVRADHKRAPEPDATDWPNATQAYATAPKPGGELVWISNTEDRGREWLLRRAALMDRMASGLIPGYTTSRSNAHDLASRLMALDGSTVGCNPRAYVRQQYVAWRQQQRGDCVTTGHRIDNPGEDCGQTPCACAPEAPF
ncbi:hypothetical protein ACH41H_21190 [Streptomyces sp. NPDC020800]|uniref:hypothetical protein n=1 Tax=Streptomyces sp. NPDC020800 TaxID=3365092 RepID=UPI003798A78B